MAATRCCNPCHQPQPEENWPNARAVFSLDLDCYPLFVGGTGTGAENKRPDIVYIPSESIRGIIERHQLIFYNDEPNIFDFLKFLGEKSERSKSNEKKSGE